MRKTLAILSLCFTTLGLAEAQNQFWGSSSFGGLYSDGFIFKTDSIGDNLQIVHHFQKAVDGENISALMLGSDNKLYGVASSGGAGGENVFSTGTLFEYDLATDQFRVLEHFGPINTKLPAGITTPRAEGVPSLFEVSPGIIFILMSQGRYVYSYNVATGVFTKPFTIPTYQGGPTNGILQNILNQTFHKAADGFLYASTQTNSMCPIPNPNMGSIIRVNPANNAISIRHKANCLIDYGYKYNGFFAEKNGKLYSTTQYGGANNQGVIFEYNPAANTFTKLHDFAGSVHNYDVTSFVLAKNGKLYGTASGGGIPEPALMLNSGGGILFEFDLATNAFTKKHDFTLTGQSIYDMGIFPSGLISSTNGKLYGATQYGVFEYNPAIHAIRVAGRFEGQAFAPSFVQVCRKPAYQVQTVTSFTICKDASFTLDMASTNANSVVWRHNGIVDETRTTTELSFTDFASTDAGTWVCTLTNECGVTVAQTITLTYGTPDKPVVGASGPLTFCEGGAVTLSAPAGFSNYMWSTGDATQEITVNESGAYKVFVSNGCDSPLSEAISVTVNELPSPPTIMAEGPVVFCEGENVILSAPEGFISYSWSTGETSRQIAVNETGSYTVKVNDGCESPASEAVSVVVNELPVATIMPAGPVIFCKGENVTLSAPEGFTGYSWSTGETSRQIIVSEMGSYTVVVRNDCESAVSEAVSVVVNELPLPAVITAAGSVVFCEGEDVMLSAPEGFLSYFWSTGETSRQIIVNKSGSFTVKVNNGCDSPPSEAVSVSVNALPQAPTDIVSDDMLTATGWSGTYAWTVNDVALDEHTSQVAPMETGIYKAYSVSAEGCRSADFAAVSFVISGTEPGAKNTIAVYPNPGQGTLNLEVCNALRGPADVSILSTTGSVVYRHSINFGSEPVTIHLGKLPAGLYHLMIRKGSQVIVRKIVIQ